MSNRTRIVFSIKESAAGTPYLHMEFHDPVPGLQNDPPAFYMREGVSMSEAEEIARYLNRNLVAYSPDPSAS